MEEKETKDYSKEIKDEINENINALKRLHNNAIWMEIWMLLKHFRGNVVSMQAWMLANKHASKEELIIVEDVVVLGKSLLEEALDVVETIRKRSEEEEED